MIEKAVAVKRRWSGKVRITGYSKERFKIVYFTTELSDVPLEELQRIRLKIGTKKFDSILKESLKEREARSFKRANKNRCLTMLW